MEAEAVRGAGSAERKDDGAVKSKADAKMKDMEQRLMVYHSIILTNAYR
jgi:hypothetical protein